MNRRDLLFGFLGGSAAGTLGITTVLSIERVTFKPWRQPSDVHRGELDKLVAEYNEARNGATFLGNQVIYSRENWDALGEAFTRIIAYVTKEVPSAKKKYMPPKLTEFGSFRKKG